MTPCLADTGSNYSMLVVGGIVLLIGVGVALLLMKKGKGAAGGALLVLFLVGAGTLGTTGASPARAASRSTSCTTSSPAPATATPSATSTPIVTPTPTPTPTCAPSSIAASIQQWGGIPAGSGLQFQGTVTDPALLNALGTHSFDGVQGSVAVTDTKSGEPVFAGDVTFGYDVDISMLLIPGSELSALAGEDSDWPFDQETTLTLSFQRSGSNDCPITVDVTGPAMGTE